MAMRGGTHPRKSSSSGGRTKGTNISPTSRSAATGKTSHHSSCSFTGFLALGLGILCAMEVFRISRQQVLCDRQNDISNNRQSSLANDFVAASTQSADGSRGDKREFRYTPSTLEEYIMNNLDMLGYNTVEGQVAPACRLWLAPPNDEIRQQLETFRKGLKIYAQRIAEVQQKAANATTAIQIPDVCNSLDLGLEELFGKKLLSHSTITGYSEPLLPPMRHPEFCFDPGKLEKNQRLYDLRYLVYDFRVICEWQKANPNRRMFFFDIGAALAFNGNPVIRHFVPLLQSFGVKLDHMYAFEKQKFPPEKIYNRLPTSLLGAYHWYNVPVTSTINDRRNPWTILKADVHPDDLVWVKLDIDAPQLEWALAQQLVGDPEIHKRVDFFYFEHHVHMEELVGGWRPMHGSIADSMKFFRSLRELGVASHFWI